MARAKSNYDIAIKDLVYRPGVSPLELVLKTAMKVGEFLA
jgi:phytoene desaturase